MAFAVDLTGSTLDRRYRITGLLGKGGMGHVYEAVHVALDQRVAVKVLHPRYADEPRYRERFLQEARAVSKIRHPNVVEIKDFGDTPDGSVYFVMEYLCGCDLGAELKRQGVLPWARVRHILLQAAGALGAAHAKRIIHRDIKPGNCFLVEDEAEGMVDVVKLLDFGIAKVGTDSHDAAQNKGLTGTGEVFGTASYMAPEQALSKPLDARSDVYSLGIMAYEMLVGRVPFTGGNAIEVITRHMREEPVPLRKHDPKIPAVVEALVLEMIAKAPGDRPESMAVLGRALQGIAEDVGVKRTRLWGSVSPTAAGRAAAGAIDAGTSTDVDATVVARGARRKVVVPADDHGSSADGRPPPASRAGGRATRGATMVAPRTPAVGRVEPGTHASRGATAGDGVPAEARGSVATAPVAASPTTGEPSSSGLLSPAWVSGAGASDVAASSAASFAAGWRPDARGVVARAEAPAWHHGSVGDGAYAPGHGDWSASAWPQSTSSTGPHGAAGDAGSETRPHSLEPVGMRGGGTRRLVVVSMGLMLLVGGGSAAVTMAVLAKSESEREGVAADGAVLERAREQPRAGSPMGGRGGSDDAVHEATEPVVLAGGPSEGARQERTDDAVSGEGGAVDAANASASEIEPARPSPKPHESKQCSRVRQQANAAYARRDWKEVVAKAKETRCWAPDQQPKRRRMHVKALAEGEHFEECIAVGRAFADPYVVTTVSQCKRRLMK